MQTVQDIRDQFAEKFLNKEFVGNTIEIIGATFLADEPSIFGEINHDWNRRELNWYYSQSRFVTDIEEPIPAIWKHIASKKGEINSNYGWCVFSEENYSQYSHVLDKLKSDKNTRQAVMLYNRPSMHIDFNKDDMTDFLCTFANQFFIRNGKLISHYSLRSQDSVFGYKGDCFWASTIHKQLAKDLLIECGDLIWTAGSIHIYDRHYYLIDHYCKTGEINISKENYVKLYPDSEYL